MKSTILNLIVMAAMLFGNTVFAADEEENMAQPVEIGTETTGSVEQPAMPAVSELPSATEKLQPAPYLSSAKRDKPTKYNRSKSLDLRYCLELESNVEIAKCAGE